LKAFDLLESAILILLEKDDKHLATENMMQLLKCLEHITAIFTSIYNLEKRKSKIMYDVRIGDICFLLWLISQLTITSMLQNKQCLTQSAAIASIYFVRKVTEKSY